MAETRHRAGVTKICSTPGCVQTFVDHSKNGKGLFCPDCRAERHSRSFETLVTEKRHWRKARLSAGTAHLVDLTTGETKCGERLNLRLMAPAQRYTHRCAACKA